MNDVKAKPHYSGHRQRLRERLLESKKGGLPDYEILEILLFSAHPRKDVKPIAKALIARFGNLSKVLNAPPAALNEIDGVTPSAIAMFRATQEAAERLLKQQFSEDPILNNWKALLDYCRASMAHRDTEQFRVLYLNKKNRLIADELQEAGTIDQTPVYVREVAKRVLELSASSIILIHNHPSGDPKPSRADIDITRKIIQGITPLGATVHDHLIISHTEHFSFKSNGLI